VLAREMRLRLCDMGMSISRHRVLRAVLLLGLVLLATAERRLAYLDFDAPRDVRLENNDKPDGDEIINRLVFLDTSTGPIGPSVGEVYIATVVLDESNGPSLVVVRLSESRAPPLSLPA
jgi:hypothetical protein